MSEGRKTKKPVNPKKIIVIVIIFAVAVFILFPRRYAYLDGGSVAYGSFDYGFIYSVEQRHRLPSTVDKNGYGYYENGTVIKIFGIEIYSNAKTDYDDLAITPHSTEMTYIETDKNEAYEN